MKVVSDLRFISRTGALVAWTAGILPAVRLAQRIAPNEHAEKIFDAYMRRWCRGWLGIMRVDTQRVGDVPPLSGGALVVANHRTVLDIPILLEAFGGSVLSRHDIADWPLFGKAAKMARTVFVDRQDERSGLRAVRTVRRRLQAGETIIVFPEGTTYPGDEVRPFVGGAFVAAHGLAQPIIPVGLAYNEPVEFFAQSSLTHLQNLTAHKKLHVAISIGDAVEAGSDAKAMARQLRERVQNEVDRARLLLGRRA